MKTKQLAVSALLLMASGSLLAINESASFASYWQQSELIKAPKFEALDIQRIESEDAINDASKEGSVRFAIPRAVNYTPFNSGDWREQGSMSRWLLPIKGTDIVNLNFGFSTFKLPKGAELRIIASDGETVAGPYTQENQLAHGQLWTPVLMGSEALIALDVPTRVRTEVDLRLTQVSLGYRGFGVGTKCKSGSCNTDVACMAPADPWNQNSRAVGAITRNGTDTCSGSLLNNTNNDRRMLFATAAHCGIGTTAAAATVRVYWKYESPTCREPGSAASGASAGPKPNTSSAGLNFIAQTRNPFGGGAASIERSDFTLLELETPPVGNNFDLYFAGWDRRSAAVACQSPESNDPFQTSGRCASIHHPGVDEKRITFIETPITAVSYQGGITSHWQTDWDATPALLPNMQQGAIPPSVTEGGSSGSPVYSAERRLVGVLSGGPSSCGATGASLRDFYGALYNAWEGIGTPATRMKDHLDPTGSNAEFINGLNGAIPEGFANGFED